MARSRQLEQILVENVARLREQRGMTLNQLARAAKVSSSTLGGLLYRSCWPHPDFLNDLATALEVSPSTLLHDSNEPDAQEQAALAAGKVRAAIRKLCEALEDTRTPGAPHISEIVNRTLTLQPDQLTELLEVIAFWDRSYHVKKEKPAKEKEDKA